MEWPYRDETYDWVVFPKPINRRPLQAGPGWWWTSPDEPPVEGFRRGARVLALSEVEVARRLRLRLRARKGRARSSPRGPNDEGIAGDATGHRPGFLERAQKALDACFDGLEDLPLGARKR